VSARELQKAMIEGRALLHLMASLAIGRLCDPSLPYEFAKSVAAVADVCARWCWWSKRPSRPLSGPKKE
jgi:hypothetical protein